MAEELFKLVRIASLKSVDEFRRHVAGLNLELVCDDALLTGPSSPLAQAVGEVKVNGKSIRNRVAMLPMEGWDGTTEGGVTLEMMRRWRRFGESGAALIYGGEAMAVTPEGRANPHQIIINRENAVGIASLRGALEEAHHERCGAGSEVVIGFQLTHSGRFCRPRDKKRLEPRIVYRHPILDRKFGITTDAAVLADEEVEVLIQDYVNAARIAVEAGADFVDIKHCHGYLLHEFLSAYTRPGRYGGSFENRTRVLREIVEGIRGSGNTIDLGVRLSAFDFVPFRPDPARSEPGKLGPGIPEDYSQCLPYRYGFGTNPEDPVHADLSEAKEFIRLCGRLGVKLVNLSAGSPYYNPHIQRPAAYPPSDGYQPAHDPLIDVVRQIQVVRELKATAPTGMVIIGSAYSYLQEYLPQVAQAVVRAGWTDMVGLGRMALSYPTLLADVVEKGSINAKAICRTFSDCTTAPRNGLISGCYPLDKFYSERPEFQTLKEIKRRTGG